MRDANSCSASVPFTSLPVVLDQSPSQSSPVILITLLIPVVAGLSLPFVALAQELAADASARSALAEKPIAAVQLILAAIALTSLFAWPLVRLLRKTLRKRVVRIEGSMVECSELGLFRRKVWSQPMASYEGISRRVLSSLSGVSHELLLVHRDRRRSVTLAVAAGFSQEQVDQLAALLNVAEIPSRDASSVVTGRNISGASIMPLPFDGRAATC
ncbi:MAG: hypothetical protein WC807_13610 [Hyphomicrobium sp.]|jgi:hypothetical protein